MAAQRFYPEAGYLASNSAGLIEYIDPTTSATQGATYSADDTTRASRDPGPITEVRENVQATLGFLAENTLTTDDVQDPSTLLNLKASKDEVSGHAESSQITASTDSTTRPAEIESSIDLDNIIPRPNQGRALRNRRLTNPMAYDAKYHPVDEVLKPKQAANAKSNGKK